jgi:hypothetical protein
LIDDFQVVPLEKLLPISLHILKVLELAVVFAQQIKKVEPVKHIFHDCEFPESSGLIYLSSIVAHSPNVRCGA